MFSSCNSDLKEQFENPPDEFKPMPFWHINGELTTDEIRRQVRDARELAGFSGISLLPLATTKPERPGTSPKFLSEEYLDRYQDLLDIANEMEMEVILYDDNDFPSGMAGGMLGEQFPEHTMKRLDKLESIIEGPRSIELEIPEGKLHSVVAMNSATKQRIDLEAFISDSLLQWSCPDGSWQVMFFVSVKDSHHKAYPVVDYLDTVAVRHMIDLTYEVYKNRFGSYFGNTIKKTFFDDIGFWKHPRTWTGNFDEKFRELNGYDPAPWYPALWYDIGPQTAAVRNAFFNTRAELLAEGFPKLVAEWAKKNGLQETGHPPGNYDPSPIDMNGDIFKFFRHTAIPLTDAIISYQFGQNGFKLVSSAADYYDRPVVATEIYGAFRENTFDSLMLYRAMMDLFVRGVNFVVPHGLWYNPEKIYIPPLVSPYSEKVVDALPRYSDFVGRSCMLLQGGRKVANIGVFYPIEELSGWFRFDDPAQKRQGFFVSPETDYQTISGILSNDLRQDFTFIHPELFRNEKYVLDGDQVVLNNVENRQKYQALIITGCHTISYKTLMKIRDFYLQGGVVIATTQLPSQSSEMGEDYKVQALIKEIFGQTIDPYEASSIRNVNGMGGKAFFMSDPSAANLEEVLSQSLVPDVDFNPQVQLKTDFGKFSYIHKVKDGKHLYYFANSSDELIQTEVSITGNPNLEAWNPHDGLVSSLKRISESKKGDQSYTKYNLTLDPVSSVFWREE